MKRGRKSEQFYWKWPHYIIILVLHYTRQIKDVKIIREFLIVLISIHDKSEDCCTKSNKSCNINWWFALLPQMTKFLLLKQKISVWPSDLVGAVLISPAKTFPLFPVAKVSVKTLFLDLSTLYQFHVSQPLLEA